MTGRKRRTGRLRPLLLLALLLLLLPLGAAAEEIPAPRGYVNDFADVIDPAAEREMERLAGGVSQACGAEIVVAAFPTMAPYGSIEEFGIAVAEKWQPGQSGEDNGVILLLALEERKVRIEVGYGLEGVLTDGTVGRIMDISMVPAFQEGNFSTGFSRSVEGIAGLLAEEYGFELSGLSMAESEKYRRNSRGRKGIPIGTIIFLLFIFMRGGGRFLFPWLFFSSMSRGYSRGGFGGSRSGFGGGSFGGGGFSGFGGGGFGGGGASRGF